MYREQVQDIILERMLERVGARYDKREGSIIWDALAPAAVEFQNFFYALAAVLDEVFPDTATRKYLIKHCTERGIEYYKASPAVVLGEFTPTTVDVPIGERFSHEDLNYVVTEKVGDGLYHLKCETVGSIANGQTGRLIPIGYINGLETANIVEIVVPGEDDESTESLRARYFDSLKSEPYGGNKKDYKDWVLAIAGVGGCKIYSGSEWNGGGTVLVVVQDSQYGVPSDGSIRNIQHNIDPDSGWEMYQWKLENNIEVSEDEKNMYENVPMTGSGEGKEIAPVGHFVTVVPVNVETINFEFTLDYNSGHSWDTVKLDVEKAVDDYIAGLNERWQNNDHIVIRIAHIESALLDIPGVLDVKNTRLSGSKPVPGILDKEKDVTDWTESNYSADKNSIIQRGTINGY